MNIYERVKNKIKKFLWKKMFKKGIEKFAMVIISYAMAKAEIISKWGIQINISPEQFQMTLTALFAGTLEMIRNFIKHKILKK